MNVCRWVFSLRPTLNRMKQTDRAKEALNDRFFYLRRLLSFVVWGTLLSLGLLILIKQAIDASRTTTDFCQDYFSAEQLLQGTSPYARIQGCPMLLPYNSQPPTSVLLFLPWGLLPPSVASTLWGLISLAAYLVSGIFFLKALDWQLLRGLAIFVVASLFWQPLVRAEAVQNVGQIILFLLALAWYLERRGQEFWAGSLLGLAGLLKIWPAVLVVGALLRQRWRSALAGVSVMGLEAVLTLLVMGSGVFEAYLGPVQASEQTLVSNGGNISLVGTIIRPLRGFYDPPLTLPPLLPGLSLAHAVLLGEIVAGLLLIATLALIWWCGLGSPSDAQALLSQGVLVTVLVLVFPLSWQWGSVTLLFPCVTTLLAIRQMAPPPRWWKALAVLSLLPSLAPLWLIDATAGWLKVYHSTGPSGWWTFWLALPTYGLLLFAIAQAWLLWHASNKARILKPEMRQ